jgi:hypothetical protein
MDSYSANQSFLPNISGQLFTQFNYISTDIQPIKPFWTAILPVKTYLDSYSAKPFRTAIQTLEHLQYLSSITPFHERFLSKETFPG